MARLSKTNELGEKFQWIISALTAVVVRTIEKATVATTTPSLRMTRPRYRHLRSVHYFGLVAIAQQAGRLRLRNQATRPPKASARLNIAAPTSTVEWGISKPGPQTRVNDRSRTRAPVLCH